MGSAGGQYNNYTEIITRLYKNVVRPHLEYCCSVWNPHLVKDIKLIDGVQRTATKMVQDIHLSYDERLENLGL